MGTDDARNDRQDKRRERLAVSLRENLKRRKAQQRSRAAGRHEDGEAPRPLPDLKE
jgi:hypothetical protein